VVWFLGWRNLRRSTSRTVLLVAGVSIAGALLFNMSMLAKGLESSFEAVLGRLGYEVRVALRGTLPFEADALMPAAAQTAGSIAAHPSVAWAAPVLATNIYVLTPHDRATAFALGLRPELAGVVSITHGIPGRGLIINPELAHALQIGPGDVVRLATSVNPQIGTAERTAVATVDALGEYVFDLRSQRTLALPFEELAALLELRQGQASFIVVKLKDGAGPDVVVQWIETTFPALDAFSIPDLVSRVRGQLTYFNHFAAILSAVSVLVAVLLIGAVLTLAVGERLGETAALRALGLRRKRLALLVFLEGAIVAVVSAPLALLLGAALSRPLDAILRSSPGLPQDLHFFVLTPQAAIRTVILLLLTATIGGLYPAWVAGRLNIAATLHQEIQ